MTEHRSPATPAYPEVPGTPTHSTPTQHHTPTPTWVEEAESMVGTWSAPYTVVTVREQRAGHLEVCNWCWRTAVVDIRTQGWTDHACYAHGVQWYPESMRQVSTVSLVKEVQPEPEWLAETTKHRRMADAYTLHLLRSNNLCTLSMVLKHGV